MWAIRFILLAVLGALVWADSFLLRDRRQYRGLVESRAFNLALVIAHLAVSYLIVILPPARGWSARPAWLRHTSVCVGFAILGSALVCAGVVLGLLSLKQRRAVGLQSSQAGLITSGVYRHFRHPICTGVVWVSLGLALLTRNPDGLLAFPALFFAYLAQVFLEERYDIGVRFRGQYQAYRRKTRMFGPLWLWGVVAAVILLLAGVALSAGIN